MRFIIPDQVMLKQFESVSGFRSINSLNTESLKSLSDANAQYKNIINKKGVTS